MNREIYQEPLVSRYTSREMQELFSEKTKFTTWRKCWVALAESEYELGLTDIISSAMIDEMRENVDNIDYDLAAAKEKEIRHDVMAHVFEYGTKCPTAAGIIHLGATSQFVVCNTDLIIQKKAIDIIRRAILKVISNLAKFSLEFKDLPTLGFTHYQPAQLTTVGKRPIAPSIHFIHLWPKSRNIIGQPPAMTLIPFELPYSTALSETLDGINVLLCIQIWETPDAAASRTISSV